MRLLLANVTTWGKIIQTAALACHSHVRHPSTAHVLCATCVGHQAFDLVRTALLEQLAMMTSAWEHIFPDEAGNFVTRLQGAIGSAVIGSTPSLSPSKGLLRAYIHFVRHPLINAA